jgi:hypothetical protein
MWYTVSTVKEREKTKMAKKNIHTYTHENRTFELVTVCEAGFHGERAITYIHEVIHPTWKIFRTICRDSFSFWVEHYYSILEGEKAMLEKYLALEVSEKALRSKWEEFNKS